LIKAVFFDWSFTLARYIPSREELQCQALGELGILVSPSCITAGLAVADRYLWEESSVSSIRQRSLEERAALFVRYEQKVLAESGVRVPTDSANFPKLIKNLDELYKQLKFVLYDDVLPAVKSLKQKNLVLALVTNMDADMKAICRELGLAEYLDLIITSSEVGASKPQPKIFLTALQMAGLNAAEVIHLGDQPDIDIAGARGAGIQPVLLDRDNIFPAFVECPRIRGLAEVDPLIAVQGDQLFLFK
jgi:putative hydrolase of the HAD superfamily